MIELFERYKGKKIEGIQKWSIYISQDEIAFLQPLSINAFRRPKTAYFAPKGRLLGIQYNGTLEEFSSVLGLKKHNTVLCKKEK